MRATTRVSGVPAGPRAGAPAPDGFLARAVELLLLVLPSAHLLYVPVAGAMATGADVALGLVGLAWGAEALRPGGSGRALLRAFRGEQVPGLPGRRVLLGLTVLAVFGVWVGASGLWGFHPAYAAAKGLGTVALAVAAAALATSGLPWRRAADAWLGGVGVALATTLVLALAGPEILRARVLYAGGGIEGLPFPRPSGPLLHPNMLGDLLVVSGVLAWARWPELGRRGRRWIVVLSAAMTLALLLSASAAWLPAGIVVAWLARTAGGSGGAPSGRTTALRVGGSLLAAATVAGLILSVRVDLGFVELATSGIRPRIWRSAAEAVLAAPLLGVGASPYVAEAVDPLVGGGAVLWDAHNGYLSVLGQYGLVGATLAAVGVAWVVGGALAAVPAGRVRTALVVAFTAVAVDAVFMASEDIRHVWLLLGLAGLVAAVGAEEPA